MFDSFIQISKQIIDIKARMKQFNSDFEKNRTNIAERNRICTHKKKVSVPMRDSHMV